jgi:hypothetical protein
MICKTKVLTIVSLITLCLGCSNNDSLELDNVEQDKSAYAKLSGKWITKAYTETKDCDSYIDERIYEISFVDTWEIDSEGNFIHIYDANGSLNTQYGKWVFIEELEDIHKFQFITEFTTVEDESYNYFIFSDNLLRYYEDECISDDGKTYIQGTEWEKE